MFNLVLNVSQQFTFNVFKKNIVYGKLIKDFRVLPKEK